MKNRYFFIFCLLISFGLSFSFAFGATITAIRQSIASQLRAQQSALSLTTKKQLDTVRKQLGICLRTGQCRSMSSPRTINGEIYIPSPDMRFARGLPPLQPIGKIAP